MGGILIGVGGLVAGLCGLCTGVFMVMMLGGGTPAGILLPLVIGGIPTLIGVGLFQWGRSLLRKAALEDDD